MTWEEKFSENKILIALYDAFLPECSTYESRIDLMTEIGRLHTQNKRIEKMSVIQFKNDSHDHVIQMNFNEASGF